MALSIPPEMVRATNFRHPPHIEIGPDGRAHMYEIFPRVPHAVNVVMLMWTTFFSYDAEEADYLRRQQDRTSTPSSSSPSSSYAAAPSTVPAPTTAPVPPTATHASASVTPTEMHSPLSVPSTRLHPSSYANDPPSPDDESSSSYSRSSSTMRSPAVLHSSYRWPSPMPSSTSHTLTSRHRIEAEESSAQSMRSPSQWQQRPYAPYQTTAPHYPTPGAYYPPHLPEGREHTQPQPLSYHPHPPHQPSGARPPYYPVSTSSTHAYGRHPGSSEPGWSPPMFQQGSSATSGNPNSYHVEDRNSERTLSVSAPSTGGSWSPSLPQQPDSPYLARGRTTPRHNETYYSPSTYAEDDDRSMYDGENAQ